MDKCWKGVRGGVQGRARGHQPLRTFHTTELWCRDGALRPRQVGRTANKCSGSDPGRTEGRQRGRFPPAAGCCSQAPLTQRPPLPTLEAITAVIIVSRGEASGLPEAAEVPPSQPLHSQVPRRSPEPPQTPPGLQGPAPASWVASPQRRGSDLSPTRSRRRPPPGSPRP